MIALKGLGLGFGAVLSADGGWDRP